MPVDHEEILPEAILVPKIKELVDAFQSLLYPKLKLNDTKYLEKMITSLLLDENLNQFTLGKAAGREEERAETRIALVETRDLIEIIESSEEYRKAWITVVDNLAFMLNYDLTPQAEQKRSEQKSSEIMIKSIKTEVHP